VHIAEGYLPVAHATAWTLAASPFVYWSYRSLDLGSASRQRRLMLAASAGFLFALTALKFPSVAGSSSHPTGIVLGTLLLGMRAMPLLACLVLVFQAFLLAHGGLTTLGANVFSLGVVGPVVVAAIKSAWPLAGKASGAALVLATVAGSLATYTTTSLQLAVAFPDASGGVLASLERFLTIFGVAQAPVAVIEAIVTLMVWKALPMELRSVPAA
jgi:cobalt/nickel transport system permease protein